MFLKFVQMSLQLMQSCGLSLFYVIGNFVHWRNLALIGKLLPNPFFLSSRLVMKFSSRSDLSLSVSVSQVSFHVRCKLWLCSLFQSPLDYWYV